MYNGLKYFLTFSLGAAAGSIVAWRLLKTKYEQIANDEIASVKEVYSRKLDNGVRASEEQGTKDSDDGVDEYVEQVYECKYVSGDQEGGSDTVNADIRVILPESYGEDEDYETISLTYYADKVLTDDMDDPIEDIENTVGLDFHKHFGEYEDDSVFIRNDALKVDYEILLDTRNYSEVKQAILNQADDE